MEVSTMVNKALPMIVGIATLSLFVGRCVAFSVVSPPPTPVTTSSPCQKQMMVTVANSHSHPLQQRFPPLGATATRNLEEPDEDESNFGRMAYWDESYTQPTTTTASKEEDEEVQVFSWYCGWTDELGPFFEELVPEKDSLILVPGIGNDAAIRDMFDEGGYQKLMAFDYAPQGVECAKAMFGEKRIQTITKKVDISNGDIFKVCDARDLSSEYSDDTFDAVLDKGTFDSIYLSGGKDKEKAKTNLSMAISEMKRVLKDDGVVFSVTAACVDAVREAFEEDSEWKQLRDGSLHITEDGYASNNVDATMLAWKLEMR